MKINGIHEVGRVSRRVTWGLAFVVWMGFTQREVSVQIGRRYWYIVLNGGRGMR